MTAEDLQAFQDSHKRIFSAVLTLMRYSAEEAVVSGLTLAVSEAAYLTASLDADIEVYRAERI